MRRIIRYQIIYNFVFNGKTYSVKRISHKTKEENELKNVMEYYVLGTCSIKEKMKKTGALMILISSMIEQFFKHFFPYN